MPSWSGRATALAVGLAVAALLAELGLRALRGAPGRCVFPSRYGTLGEQSWLHGFRVDTTARAVRVGHDVVPLPRPADEVRILFLGDSGTAGTGVLPDEAFPSRVGRRLDAAHPDVSVRAVNAGAIGMTTIGEYYLLRDELLALEPDHVVLGLFLANDLNFNLGHREWEQARAPGLVPWLSHRSALASVLHGTALRFTVPLDPWRVPAHVPRTLIDENRLHMLSYPGGEIATYVQPPSRTIERAFALLRAVLRAFVELGDEHGFSFAVVLVPTPSAVQGELALRSFPSMLERLAEHGITIDPSALDLDQPTRWVGAICDELGIPWIDPTECMRGNAAEVFLPQDQHPTAAGHVCLADALLDRVDAWLPDLRGARGAR